MGFGGCVECKSCLIFKILLMLMECRILLMVNTVEMAGGDIYSNISNVWLGGFLEENDIQSNSSNLENIWKKSSKKRTFKRVL